MFKNSLARESSSRPLPPGEAVDTLHDKWLVLSVLGLLAVGILMVTSASITIADKLYQKPFYYLLRQLSFLGLAGILSMAVLQVPIRILYRLSPWLLLMSLGLLLFVLLPGVGHTVKGSTRWINLGLVHLQVSELAKLFLVVYFAGYLVRHAEHLQDFVSGFMKPMAILAVFSFLLLLQPDFGAAVVMVGVTLCLLFLAGVRWRQFAIVLMVVAVLLSIIAIASPYRLQRLTTFLNPWATQFSSGYQLTQSLIAFGRGGWFGVGLGESVQKLFYLPEAHTDFLFAVLAEELGLFGVLGVMTLFSVFVTRGLGVARRALQYDFYFSSYLAYGITLWMGLQALINLGVNMGVLPTKGLTLPLMSYGGSSLVVDCLAVALLLRVDHETRLAKLGVFP